MTVPSAPRRLAASLAALALSVVLAPAVRAQAPADPPVRPLALDEALRLAARSSEALLIARAALQRADGQYMAARSQGLPQVNATASYQRQLQNQFNAIARSAGSGSGSGSGTGSDSGSGGGNGTAAFTRVFASPNNVVLGLTAQQTVYAAGRVSSLTSAAAAGRRAAELGVTGATAQLQYDVAQAYFDAVVADQLVAIADTSLQQAERALRQTTIARQVGSSAEFDLLRARVARDNLRPQVYTALAQKDAAISRLKALLNLPLHEELALTTPVTEPDTAALARQVVADLAALRGTAYRAAAVVDADTSSGVRLPVRQAAENAHATRAQLRAARAARLPSLGISTNYQRFAYPDDKWNGWGMFFPNWTVAAQLSLPLFTGGRLAGDIRAAEAGVLDATQRLQLARESASLEARQAVNDLRSAQASYLASLGTDEQAARAYRIAEVRYAEGISTQLELIESRTQLAQARATRVTAARTLALARLRLSLLKELPFGVGAGAGAGAAGAGGGSAMPSATGIPQGGGSAAPRTAPAGPLANVQGQN